MIVTSISAGLGNQLFQYAFGRVLSLHHNVPLKTELYWFTHEQNVNHRRLGLTHFNIKAPEATWQELDEYIQADTRFHRLIKPYYKRIRIQEHTLRYDENVWKFPRHTYVLGYWQAWQYYAKYHQAIRDEFEILTPPDKVAARLLEQIQARPSVSLHIRRGDYITNQSFNTLPVTYYESAIDYLREREENLNWYVFSDDIGWVKNHVAVPNTTTYVEGICDIDDFRLMHATRHNIIANSTFSWWPAWLKESGAGTVIAPSIPFTNPSLANGDTLFPPSFIRL